MFFSMDLVHVLLATLAAYLMGSLSFAVLVSRIMGLADPRSYGSQNPGATNVLRSGNKLAAALTLLLDGVKGWLPVWAVSQHGSVWGLGEGTLALAAMAAFAGHVWPVFFRFKGGKGVATAGGAMLALYPLVSLVLLALWLIVVKLSKKASLASLAIVIGLPIGLVIVGRPAAEILTTVGLGIFVIWRHWPNLKRLVQGEELSSR